MPPTDPLPEQWRARVLEPALATAELPGIGGILRACADDFVVDEIAAYAADGRPHAHALLQLRKRGLSTEDAVIELARALHISARDIGWAGRKDRDAVSRQWISVPARCMPMLAAFAHPDIELGPALPHSNKLRTGHLHGNRFELVVRAPSCPVPEAIERARAKLAMLEQGGGLCNAFGPQRFGHDGRNLDRGLAELRRGRGGARGNMIVAAGQAALFNLYLELRRERGLLRRALVGDVLKRTDSGGLFTCSEPVLDDVRLRAGELVVTGPIFGSRTMSPPPGSDAAALEHDVLTIAGIDDDALLALGRAALGTRRALLVSLVDANLSHAVAHPEHGDGVRIAVTLPAGSFATQLCAELQGDAPRAPRQPQ
jgi:tRNA pseudouridine13 synthase